MKKKFFSRALAAGLAFCMLMPTTAFAATTYSITVELSGPNKDGVKKSISDESSKYGSLDTPLAATVVQLVNDNYDEIKDDVSAIKYTYDMNLGVYHNDNEVQPESDAISKMMKKYSVYLFAERINLDAVKTDGVNQSNINAKKIGAYEFSVPTLDEQTEIVRILDSLFTNEQQAKEAAEVVLEQIDLLKKSILARAFRGELGTNDPSEESAVELVKSIV